MAFLPGLPIIMPQKRESRAGAHSKSGSGITYLAYCSTTGLDCIDYRITDRYFDPPGLHDDFYSEQSIRLADTYWCYQTPADAPEVGALPAKSGAGITFGCLNNFCKVTERTLRLWGRLLSELPGSRLILHCNEGSHRERVLKLMGDGGVSPDRISFVGKLPMMEYFNTYNAIDIALDTHPFSGGTTTCDALWMGVPVITLPGETGVSRATFSILSNVGLAELAADSDDAYVKVAMDLARDLIRLETLRTSLRQRMQASVLLNGPRYARNMEQVYRIMWRKWCRRQSRS
jgi:protein O-GlcNAc transferase